MNGPSGRGDRRPFRPTIGGLMVLIAIVASVSALVLPVLRTGQVRTAVVRFLLIAACLVNLSRLVRQGPRNKS